MWVGAATNTSREERGNRIITTRGEKCERLLGISGSPAARSVRGRARLEESDFKDDLLLEECVFVRALVCYDLENTSVPRRLAVF